jgi:hypothetical protein
MKLDNLRKIVKEELQNHFLTHPYSLKDKILMETDIMLGELLNPENSLPYRGDKGFYLYDDPNGVTFFARAHYNPIRDYLEFKTGWLDENGKAIYEPSVPYGNEKTSTKDIHSRSDTVAKIYRDEILSFFDMQNLSNILIIDPISSSRSKFAERLVNKFTSKEKYNIEKESNMIIIKKK